MRNLTGRETLDVIPGFGIPKSCGGAKFNLAGLTEFMIGWQKYSLGMKQRSSLVGMLADPDPDLDKSVVVLAR